MFKQMTITFLIILAIGCSKKKLKYEIIPEAEPVKEKPIEAIKQLDPEIEIQAVIEEIEFLKGKRALFNFDKSTLKPEAMDLLAQVAQYLMENPKVNIQINGYTCEIGTYEYNLALGQARANAGQRYLVTYGIDPMRIATVSYGEEEAYFISLNKDEYYLNRRIEFERK